MLVKTFGSAVYGICATTITIEVNITMGISFFLVGLPDNAVKESQQINQHLPRIEYAIIWQTLNRINHGRKQKQSAFSRTVSN